MRITKAVLYEALKLAVLHIAGNNDGGCSDCPIKEKDCKQTPFSFCVTNIVNDYINYGKEIVEHKEILIGK
jgi:hypothetical protein